MACIMERSVHLTLAGGGFGVEAEIFQAGGALQRPDQRGLEGFCVGGDRPQVLNGGPQRRAPFLLLPVVGLLHQHIAGNRAKHGRAQHEQPKNGDKARRGVPGPRLRLLPARTTHRRPSTDPQVWSGKLKGGG
jgi:hypothetical protein